jgi:hypothetical protein
MGKHAIPGDHAPTSESAPPRPPQGTSDESDDPENKS